MDGARGLHITRALACFLLVLLFAAHVVRPGDDASAAGRAGLIPAKIGLGSMSKTDRETLWARVDEYATVDALIQFCGRNQNLQKRTWTAVSACIETSSLRKVAAVFKAKKNQYMKAWETTHADLEKRKALCDGLQTKLGEYKRIIDAQIAEAESLCRACIFC